MSQSQVREFVQVGEIAVGEEMFRGLVQPRVGALWGRAFETFRAYRNHSHKLAAVLIAAEQQGKLEEVLARLEEQHREFEIVRATPANRERVVRATFDRMAFDMGFGFPPPPMPTTQARPVRISQR